MGCRWIVSKGFVHPNDHVTCGRVASGGGEILGQSLELLGPEASLAYVVERDEVNAAIEVVRVSHAIAKPTPYGSTLGAKEVRLKAALGFLLLQPEDAKELDLMVPQHREKLNRVKFYK